MGREKRGRSLNGLELCSMVNVKNRVQIPEAEEGELEDDDDERIEDDDSCLYEMPGQMCVRSLRLESFHAQIS